MNDIHFEIDEKETDQNRLETCDQTQNDPRPEVNELAQAQLSGAKLSEEKYETEGMADLLRKAAAEGIVLLENRDQTLPFQKSDRLAVFGRCQVDSFFVGYGSGGDIIPVRKVSILQGMEEDPDLTIDRDLADLYQKFSKANPVDTGDWSAWGKWPFFYPEMEVSDEILQKAAKECNKAVYVIGRAAGEDRENRLEPGSYYLTAAEERILQKLDQNFDSITVLLNIGNVMDLSWLSNYSHIKALAIVWQLGQEMGYAVSDVLSGKVNPSGHLTDTIAKEYRDYPSSDSFGDPVRNEYKEGIFVGYRHFESRAKDRVLYPFGYGLSYSDFEILPKSLHHYPGLTEIRASVKNLSKRPGKDVLMVYVSTDLPGSRLKRPALALVGFAKSQLLNEGEEDTENFMVSDYQLSSYDADGLTGHPSAYVLEEGTYTFYAGDSVRNLVEIGSFAQDMTVVTRQCEKATTETSRELAARILSRLPKEVPNQTRELAESGERKEKPLPQLEQISLQDVKDGKASLDDFISQLTFEELVDLSRGEGPMNSSFGAEGNTGIFGGVSDSLRARKVPVIVTSDGPAGLRLRHYTTLLPIGTALASTWNDKLVNQLYQKEAEEMEHYQIDVMLAPGMNIHRNPLCGRNFEYFSEDPYLTGWMAAAVVDGIQSKGASACPKHFACNSQETGRNQEDSVVDERTLREIYLKAFEMCVGIASPKNIMTSYNRVNGIYSHYHYDLVTTILRKEWKYQGNVMTDWWMQPGESPEFPGLKNNAYRIRAGVNVLMPGGRDYMDQGPHHSDPEVAKCMEPEVPDGLTLAELQTNAKHVLEFCLERME